MTSQISDSLTEIKVFSMLQNYVTRDRHFIFFLISTLPYPHNYHQYQHRFDDRSNDKNDYVNIHM